MTIEEIKSEIKKKLIRESVNIKKTGGQSCGMPQVKQRIKSDELDIIIEIGYYKSSLKNCELAGIIFDFIIDKLID